MKRGFYLLTLLLATALFSCTSDQSKSNKEKSGSGTDVNGGIKELKKSEYSTEPNDLIKLNINGSIKTINESDFIVGFKQGVVQKLKLQSKRVITFDEQGYLILQSNIDAKGEVKETASYKYDGLGRKTEYQCNVTEGNFSYTSKFSYDDKGRMIEEVARYSDGSLYYKATFGYDEKGNQTEYTLYNLMGNVLKHITFKYDDANRVIEESTLKPDGTLITRYIYKYDNHGNKIEHAAYNPDNSLKGALTFEYVYDAAGNWIKKTTLKNGKPIEITERIIN